MGTQNLKLNLDKTERLMVGPDPISGGGVSPGQDGVVLFLIAHV